MELIFLTYVSTTQKRRVMYVHQIPFTHIFSLYNKTADTRFLVTKQFLLCLFVLCIYICVFCCSMLEHYNGMLAAGYYFCWLTFLCTHDKYVNTRTVNNNKIMLKPNRWITGTRSTYVNNRLEWCKTCEVIRKWYWVDQIVGCCFFSRSFLFFINVSI